MTTQAFDTVGEQFVDYYVDIRGHVREQLTRIILVDHIQGSSLRVLDVGGGDGRDAVWLAEQGHEVHLVDPSEEMIAKAHENVSQADFFGRVTLDHGDPEELLATSSGNYDVVLSHGVLMYVDDPQSHVDLLARMAKPEGIVSILTKGKEGSMFRLIHDQKADEAQRLQKTDRMVNNLGLNVLAVNEESIAPLLTSADLRLLCFYGVRIASEFDKRKVDQVNPIELETIMNLELELSRKDDTKGLGQMLLFICKNGGKK